MGSIIEIIGMGCRFPGESNTLHNYWKFLSENRSAIRDIPPGRWSVKDYVHPQPRTGQSITSHAGWLEHVDRFDCDYFHISKKEAAEMDPQQRLVLEVAQEALFDSWSRADIGS